LKRIMARARGSASQILKRTSHIRIVLGQTRFQSKRGKRERRSEKQEKKAAKKDIKSEAIGKAQERRPRKKATKAQAERQIKENNFMGQKVNPTGFRLSVNRDWRSRWYALRRSSPHSA